MFNQLIEPLLTVNNFVEIAIRKVDDTLKQHGLSEFPEKSEAGTMKCAVTLQELITDGWALD